MASETVNTLVGMCYRGDTYVIDAESESVNTECAV
jgi:hypothetical protein